MTRPSQSLWLRSGSNTTSSGRREPVRATVLPVSRGASTAPPRVLVGPSGPVLPSAVEQVRAADAPDAAHRCDEPWCREVVARAGTLCHDHHALRMRRPALDALERSR